MDVKYFLYFLEIARAKNLSRAAERLYVSQSALSQFLIREENELGVKLFLRRHNTLLLTPAGQRYHEACQDILDRKNRLYQELSSLESCKVGSMAVGITPQWGCEMFSEIYSVFKREYPNYALNLFEDTTFPLLNMLKAKELDMAVLAFNRLDGIPLRCEVVCEERFVLAVPAAFCAHIQASSGEGELPMAGLGQFSSRGFILSRHGTAIREIQDEMFASNGIQPNIVCEINNFDATLRLVSDGLGLSIIPLSSVRPSPRLRYFFPPRPWSWKIGVAYRNHFVHSAASAYLLELVNLYFEEGAPAARAKLAGAAPCQPRP